MLENSKAGLMKWVPSEDMETIARLCRIFNKGKFYEIFWEYCGLNAEMLCKRKPCGWLYYEKDELSGFALGRRRRGSLHMDGWFCFEEVWGPCDGSSNELGQLGKRDVKRALQFRNLVDSLDFKLPIALRAPTDNQFALIVARILNAKWVNGLVIAQRRLNRRFEFSIPVGYEFRMFEDGDQFYMSKIHEEAFDEDFSSNDYKAWATATNCQIIIAIHHEEPVGFVIAEKRQCGGFGDFNIAVKPPHQGKGIGSALLKAAFNCLINMKVRNVVADYLVLNASAHILYQRLGFKPKRIYNYFLLRPSAT